VDHGVEAMPPITDFIPKGMNSPLIRATPAHDLCLTEDGDVSDDDDELEVGGVTQDYKCPLTLTLLEEPVTS
jgi:E3 SUMO-protein ligase NSE2